jgi:transcriptional regulator
MSEWSASPAQPASNGAMAERSSEQAEMLQGTLDMLVLQSLVLGPAHGYTIARLIQQRSDDLLQVGQGSLYPALHRLETRKWIASFWGTSENNRKARYYRLTPLGKRQLAAETSKWHQLVHAVSRVLRPMEEQ